jgi:cyclopropane fatty-acyl-phospholipid synthase-like methyltransferase
MKTPHHTIIEYYDTCESDYRLFWDLDQSLAMHAGYWDETTKKLRDALRRENEILAQMADIQAADRVLDAGCGIGGSTLFLAQNIGCQAVGISLSEKQILKATELAKKHSLANLTTFEVKDFICTGFEDASFDVVWGLESVCHAQDKQAFINEAYRLLKPSGRLIVADGFSSSAHLNSKQQKHMETWLRGWGCDALETVDSFKSDLEKSGFKNITYENITNHVFPSSKQLFYISLPALVLSKMGEYVGLRTAAQTQNIRAAFYQYTTLKKGLWEYGIFLAHKE